MATPIGTIGNIPSLTVGGRVFTDLTTLIKLTGVVTSNSRATLRLHTGSAGYQVTSGKTLKIEAARAFPSTTSAGVFQLAQSDNDVGFSASTAFTNPVYFGGDSSAVAINYAANSVSNASNSVGDLGFNVAATKYCSVLNTGGGYIQAFGYET